MHPPLLDHVSHSTLLHTTSSTLLSGRLKGVVPRLLPAVLMLHPPFHTYSHSFHTSIRPPQGRRAPSAPGGPDAAAHKEQGGGQERPWVRQGVDGGVVDVIKSVECV